MEGGHLTPSHTIMKSANSIECACGGNYVKKNKSRHIKTKLHQAYMEHVCGNPGCGTELDEEEMIVYSLSRNGVETRWCEECFDNDGLEARRNGWVFDGDGEDILNERIEQAVYHCSHCDKTSHDEQECTECGFSGYAPELGCRDEACDVCKKGKESEFFCDVHTDLHVKHDGDGGYYCDECDE